MALNGRLDPDDLAYIPGTKKLIRKDLALQFGAWRQAFEREFNKPMIVTDAYRSYSEGPYSQVGIFEGRYTPQYLAGRPRKWYKGTWWYQRPYTAMAAVPGTSNHGWATAVDLGSGINSGYSDEWEWAVETAPTFGFRWPSEWARSAREWWHFEDGNAVPVSNYVSVPGVSIDLSGLNGSLGELIEKDGFDMAEVKEVVDELVKVFTPIVKREALSAVVQAVDDRRARDRKDILEQSAKANQEVIANINALVEKIVNYTDGNEVLPGESGQFYTATRDGRVISRRTEELVKELLDIVRPLAPRPDEDTADEPAPTDEGTDVDVTVTVDEGGDDTPDVQ